MERDHFSKEWDDAPMPHLDLLHEARPCHPRQPRCQAPRHAGLAWLRPAAASERQKLFALVEQEGVLNTTVTLVGVAPSSARRGCAAAVLPRNTDDLDPDYSSRRRRNSRRAMANQPVYGNPYYAQQQYQQPYGQQQYQPYGQQQQYQPYGRPNTLPRPGYVYRDPYSGQVYQQQRPGGTLFPY